MIFEIINPSDHYTIETNDYKAASVTALIFGEGKYALVEIEGDFEMPMFIFGGSEDWVREQFDCTIDELLEEAYERPDELIRCLESIVIGDRKEYLAGLGDKIGPEKWIYWETWQEDNRSSSNDIGRYAIRYAEALRKKQENEREKQNGHQPTV